MLLVEGLHDPLDAERIAHQVLNSILEPVHADGIAFQVGASIGVALATVGMTAGDLMRCADIAMYSAKARGKNRVERFDTSHHGNIAHHRTLDDQLPFALERGEIVLRYQPYLDVKAATWSGVQCTALWEHPVLGTIDPETLATVAARTGHSLSLTEYILRLIRQHVTECRIHVRYPELRFEVAMSVYQLADPRVLEVIIGSGMAPAQMAVRVTKTEEADRLPVIEHLRRLTALGINAVFDDDVIEGLPLATVREMPISTIRLNPRPPARHDDAAMLTAVARMMGIQMLAVNVETFDDLERLRPLSVDAVQGSLLAPPMAVAEFATRLALPPPTLPNRMSALKDDHVAAQ